MMIACVYHRCGFLFILFLVISFFFFFQAEDGIRDLTVTGVQTCALPSPGARIRTRCGGSSPRRRGPDDHAPPRAGALRALRWAGRPPDAHGPAPPARARPPGRPAGPQGPAAGGRGPPRPRPGASSPVT